MAYDAKTECEWINGRAYYYLWCSQTWHVFVHNSPHMLKIAENVPTLAQAKQIAHEYSQGGTI